MDENDIKTEIEALIAGANHCFEERNKINNRFPLSPELDAIEHEIYVQALKDLAERLGVELSG